MPQTAEDRAAALERNRRERFESWFSGRRWRVLSEATGVREKDGIKISFFRGFFQVTPPAVFQTPFGYKGRSGYLIQEIDAAGADVAGTPPQSFGRIVLEQAIERYQAVTGLPERDPRRRAGTWIT